MNIYITIVIVSWLVFVFYWATSAFFAKRTVRRNYAWSWVGIRILVSVIIADIFANHYFGFHVADFVMHDHTLQAIGAALTVVGIGFAIWARYYLGRNWGMPMSVREHPELVTTGPYAYVRHPIYTGVILATLGSTLTANLLWLAVFVFTGAYFVFSAKQEEKLMLATFPDTYPTYKRRTKMLIPFIF
jgi:protein-S-isoprenylcysteine O-methyltransferase Ste14